MAGEERTNGPERASPAATAAVFVLAAAARLGTGVPSGKFPADADALLGGMRALDVLAGGRPVFVNPPRLGALEAWLSAPFVALLGPTRPAVFSVAFLESMLAVAFVWLLARHTLGARGAFFAGLVAALAPPAVLDVTTRPGGYGAIFACGAAVLALAAAWDAAPRRSTAAAFGLAAGLAFWCSIQTLAPTLAAAVWLFTRRTDGAGRRAAAAAGGALAGAAPWLLSAARHGAETIRGNYGATPVSGAAEALSNLFWAVTGGFRELVGVRLYAEPGGGATALALLQGLVVLWFLATAASRAAPGTWRLPALAALLALAFFSVSSAGSLHHRTARLLLFVWPLVVVADGAALAAAFRRSRLAGGSLAVLLAAFHVSGYEAPWSDTRAMRREGAREDAALLDVLVRERIEALLGDYWSVYPFNYLSGGRVRAIASDPIVDYLAYARRLPPSGARWALASDEPGVVERWVERAGLRGSSRRVGRFTLFLPEPNPPAEPTDVFKERVQRAFLLPTRLVPSDRTEPPLGLWR